MWIQYAIKGLRKLAEKDRNRLVIPSTTIADVALELSLPEPIATNGRVLFDTPNNNCLDLTSASQTNGMCCTTETACTTMAVEKVGLILFLCYCVGSKLTILFRCGLQPRNETIDLRNINDNNNNDRNTPNNNCLDLATAIQPDGMCCTTETACNTMAVEKVGLILFLCYCVGSKLTILFRCGLQPRNETIDLSNINDNKKNDVSLEVSST